MSLVSFAPPIIREPKARSARTVAMAHKTREHLAVLAVSYDHEAIIELFRQRKTLAVELLTERLGVEVPRWSEIDVGTADLGQVDPVETRADLVLTLEENDEPVFGIIVEVQLSQNAEKLLRWPLYATTLRARHRCPVSVLVVAPDEHVANWAQQPIILSPRSRFYVEVLDPRAIPRITSPDVPPELALLSVKAHAETEGGEGVVLAALKCGMALDPDDRLIYHDRLLAWLGPVLREKVKAMLEEHYPYPQSDFAKEHYGKGLREGEAAMLLRQLARRFGALSSDIERRVRDADSDTLLRWGDRVLDASNLDDIFSDD